MKGELLILLVEILVVYGLVLGAHAVRGRFGLAPFYVLLGGITAMMSWVTDAGVRVQISGITFMVGSTAFYTALLLGVFAVYVFDGPRATRVAISAVAVVSALLPLTAWILHLQMQVAGPLPLPQIPTPSLRINLASLAATVADLVFLAVVWEYLGSRRVKVRLWLRLFMTLLGVMTLDVLLFNSAAFAGRPDYLAIMSGTLLSRLFICLIASPILAFYVNWQNRRLGGGMENRPLLAILYQVAEMRAELNLAQLEIERRLQAERKNEQLIAELQHALAEVKTLRGLLPICANCKKIRDEKGLWQEPESYMSSHSHAEFSHGICPDCAAALYPEYRPKRPGP